jgi:chromosome segregation ATPase
MMAEKTWQEWMETDGRQQQIDNLTNQLKEERRKRAQEWTAAGEARKELERQLEVTRRDLADSTAQLELDNEECVALRRQLAEAQATIATLRKVLEGIDWVSSRPDRTEGDVATACRMQDALDAGKEANDAGS